MITVKQDKESRDEVTETKKLGARRCRDQILVVLTASYIGLAGPASDRPSEASI
jgi:hypothetical protein